MENLKRSYYAIIPANVRYDKRLKANVKLLYGEITALCNEKRYCWARNKYFAELYGVDPLTVSRWISQLVKYGYVESRIKYVDGSKEIEARYLWLPEAFNNTESIGIDLSIGIDKKVNRDTDEKVNKGTDEKIKDNNTLLNTTNTNISKKEREQKSSNFFAIGKSLNFEKDSSKAKAFEETESQLQNLSLSQESVVCNKSKAGSQKNNSEMKALDLSKNDLACQKTKASRVKTIENLKPFDEIIEAYTQNEKLRFELKEHLKIRKQKKAALTNRAIELSLQKLNSLASSDEEKLQIVQNAVMGGWTTFYPLRREEREPRHMRSESKSGNIFADMCETLKAEKEKENNYFEISVNSHD